MRSTNQSALLVVDHSVKRDSRCLQHFGRSPNDGLQFLDPGVVHLLHVSKEDAHSSGEVDDRSWVHGGNEARMGLERKAAE